jgi:hypothetical protein
MDAAHGSLTQGMAYDGHIPAGTHEVTRTDEATPVTSSYPVWAYRVAKLDLTVQTCPRQQSIMTQGAHEQ